MKKRPLNLDLLIALMAAGAGSAEAGLLTIGNYDDGNCFPFNCNDTGTSTGISIHYQQIYAASSFLSAGSISSISFFDKPGVSPNVLNGNYSISFSTSPNTVATLSSTLANNVGADNSAFFVGALGGSIGSIFTITGTPFPYNPFLGDLLIDIIVSNQDLVPNNTGNSYFWADYTGSETTRVYSFVGGPDALSVGTGALVTEFEMIPEPATILAGVMLVSLVGHRFLRHQRCPDNSFRMNA